MRIEINKGQIELAATVQFGTKTMTTQITLKGSEKQIAWAEDIRTKGLALLDEHVAEFEAHIKSLGQLNEQQQAMLPRYYAAVENIRTNDSAAWWIENRFEFGSKQRVMGLINNIVFNK